MKSRGVAAGSSSVSLAPTGRKTLLHDVAAQRRDELRVDDLDAIHLARHEQIDQLVRQPAGELEVCVWPGTSTYVLRIG